MPQRVEALVQAVLEACDRGRFDGMDGLARQAMEQAGGDQHLRARTRIHAAHSLMLYRRGRMAEATREAAAALRGSQASPCPWTRAEGRVAWARIDWSLGKLDDALGALGEALVEADRGGDDRLRLHVRNLLGLVHADLGDLDTSLRWHDDALRCARRAGVPDLVLVASTNVVGRHHGLAERHRRNGDEAAARAAWQRALEGAEQAERDALAAGLPHGLPHVMTMHAAALVGLGRPDEAVALLQRAREVAERQGDLSSLPHAARHLADARLLQGRPDEARAALLDGLMHAERAAHPARQADLLLALCDLEESQDRLAEALAHHRRFHALREACAVDQARNRSMALAVQLETDEALAAARQAHELAREASARAAHLAREASTDALTGLANRRQVDEELPRLWQRAREQQRPLALALLDLDHFKQVNDHFSHAVGDEVLRHLGQLLRQQRRDGDLAARLGGEEFLLTFDGADPVAARAAAERLRVGIQSHDWASVQAGLVVTVSIGLADLAASPDVASALADADHRLYRAKAQGRNRVV